MYDKRLIIDREVRIMRILIGFNGSEAATAALHDLRHAGFPVDSEVVIMTVVESWLPPKTADEAASVSAAGKALLCDEFPNWTVTAKTVSGSPPREILAFAESFKPDLIVVGEPRHNLSEHKMFIGHTSQTILTEADCSVRVARGSVGEKQHIEKILVGFDGSAGAAHAVDSIVRRKWRTGTEVRLLAVADSSVLSSIGRFTPQMNNAVVEAKFALQWAETLAAAFLEKLREAGICSAVEVRLGHPKDTIIQEADKWNADMIFVGPHCAGNSYERFLIGSVSTGVAAKADCSVEIVRA